MLEVNIQHVTTQRIAITTREGRNKDIRLERFDEALKESESGLTYSALTGARKQSVSDAERLFGASLCQWFKNKGYESEATYLEVVNNWHRAGDEHGLSEGERSRFNYEMLNFLLDDLMPWHRTTYDLSLLEVNRFVLKSVNIFIKVYLPYYSISIH